METDAAVEIRSQRGFPLRLGKHKTLSTVPTRPDGGSITGCIFSRGSGPPYPNSAADARRATMEFFENDENGKRDTTEMPGKGTQVPSPSPDPFPC